jgi:hypothetical protein
MIAWDIGMMFMKLNGHPTRIDPSVASLRLGVHYQGAAAASKAKL